jgi:SAM-dependent methyltransferase
MAAKHSRRIDTRALGLDVSLAAIRWLTGAENLHYGLWDGLEPVAGNLRAAQEAYTDRLLARLPPGRLRILDIGGGAGETARKLLAAGHRVEIVVPSAFLAARCRANAPGAVVHETTFERAAPEPGFDVCLFAESFQYIPLEIGLAKALGLLAPGGRVILADCFRSDAYQGRRVHGPKPGGGHRLSAFRELVARLPAEVLEEEDITDAVAPSINLEQAFFNVIGHALVQGDTALAARRPLVRRLVRWGVRAALSEPRRAALWTRLTGRERTAEAFRTFNRYLVLVIAPRAVAPGGSAAEAPAPA